MQIDNNFLADLGLASIPEEEKRLMIVDIYKLLSARIGERAEQALDEAKQEEFGQTLDSGDQEAVTAWLANNLPNYQAIVSEEVEKVKEEIRPQVPGIVAEFSNQSQQ